eukprot:SAG22_NODE_152_length_17377_cov_191.856928_13_plen_363_part_00
MPYDARWPGFSALSASPLPATTGRRAWLPVLCLSRHYTQQLPADFFFVLLRAAALNNASHSPPVLPRLFLSDDGIQIAGMSRILQAQARDGLYGRSLSRCFGRGYGPVRQRSSVLKAVITAFPSVSLPFFAVPLRSQRTTCCNQADEPRLAVLLSWALAQAICFFGEVSEIRPFCRASAGFLPFCLSKAVPFRAVRLSFPLGPAMPCPACNKGQHLGPLRDLLLLHDLRRPELRLRRHVSEAQCCRQCCSVGTEREMERESERERPRTRERARARERRPGHCCLSIESPTVRAYLQLPACRALDTCHLTIRILTGAPNFRPEFKLYSWPVTTDTVCLVALSWPVTTLSVCRVAVPCFHSSFV